MSTLYIGLDLHKRSGTFCVKDREGTIYDRRKVTTSIDSFRQYVRPFAAEHEVHIALEPVHEWYAYADLIEEAGAIVHLANPLKVKAIADARNQNRHH